MRGTFSFDDKVHVLVPWSSTLRSAWLKLVEYCPGNARVLSGQIRDRFNRAEYCLGKYGLVGPEDDAGQTRSMFLVPGQGKDNF